MQYRKLVLPVLAVCSLAFGLAAQKPKAEPTLAVKLFANAKAEDFVGNKACADCHPTQVEEFSKSGHAQFVSNPHLPIDKQGCEACHGPGKKHLDENEPENIAYTKIDAKEVDAACLRCHKDTLSASHWARTEHANAGLACTSCHQIHPGSPAPKKDDEEEDTKGGKKKHIKTPLMPFNKSTGQSLVLHSIFPAAQPAKALLKADEPTLCGSCHQSQVTQFRFASHHPVPEGRVTCSDCHETHKNKSADKKMPLLKEKCVQCHGDIAGPFVYEHDPVAGWSGDGCKECHRPHGTQNPSLLRAFSNGLCAQCHTDKTHNHYTGKTCWSAGCHVAVHGSNTDEHLLKR